MLSYVYHSPGGLTLNSLCPKPPTSLFWAQFSVRFAQAAIGTAYFLANGEGNPAYSETSFFGCYELDNIRSGIVTRLVVLNAHRRNKGKQPEVLIIL